MLEDGVVEKPHGNSSEKIKVKSFKALLFKAPEKNQKYLFTEMSAEVLEADRSGFKCPLCHLLHVILRQ